jgi:glycosyltransferase involved in cell wall biosynthesis
MKIGVILDNEYITDIRVTNEVNYLKSVGYDVHVLCPAFSGQKTFEVVEGISIHRFTMSRSLKNKLYGLMNSLPLYELYWIKKVRAFVKETQPDYLHAHDLYMSKIAFKGGNSRIPVVLDLHENFPAAVMGYRWSTRFPYSLLSRPSAWKRKEAKYIGYASKLVVLSSTFKGTLTKRYSTLKPENVFVYPNVPDVTQLMSFPVIEEIFPKQDRFILFYFGGINERRGIFTCFDAIKILSAEIPSIHLLLIGPVDGHEQINFNRALNDPILKKHVTHYKWKELSELPSYLMASDVCLSPIFKDDQHESGVANKIFQYMLFSKPLIVSDCAPQIEIVQGNNCGLVFKSEDAKDLAEKIRYLYLNPQLGKEMGDRGKIAVLQKYTVEVCGEQLDALYKSIGR